MTVEVDMARIPFIFLTTILGAAAWAQSEPELIGTFRDWDSYVLENEAGKICYIASDPLDSKPEMAERGDAWVLVTHRPDADIKDEVGLIAGYEYLPGTPVTAIIDTKKYQLFTNANGAWLHTPEDEADMVFAMKKGKRMTVVGSTRDGITTSDKYSLLGFTAAHKKIGKACNIR